MISSLRSFALHPIRFPLLLSALVLSVGCSRRARDVAPRPEVAAPTHVSDAFTIPVLVSTPAEGGNSTTLALGEGNRVAIKRAALEKEFLLQANVIPQGTAALGGAVRSRIVSFRLIDDRLFMLEAGQGHHVAPELPHNLILASFPVVSATPSEVVFDFNTGMSEIIVAEEWAASDLEKKPDDTPEGNIKVRRSFLRVRSLSEAENRLELRQVAQVELPPTGKGTTFESPTIEIAYYLSPYAPPADYVPFPSPGFDQMGFFETSPLLGASGRPVTRATRFHPGQPIVYAISANTPAEYRDAVREGVLYYNKILGADRIKVVDAPADVNAPNPSWNIIQWVDWETAGYAYADAQFDPRSGRIQHVQIYLSSDFAVSSRDQVRRLLRKLSTEGTPSSRAGSISLRGFPSARLCSHPASERLAEELASTLESGATDEAILRVSRDHVREVVAHEVGHTLGLRHNFAGSTASHLSITDRDKAFHAYLLEGKPPLDSRVTSSVMDYHVFEDSVIAGLEILRGDRPFEYDEKALQTLYQDRHFNRQDVPAFCTDSRIDKDADCDTFDSGSSVAASALYEAQSYLKSLPYLLFESFVAIKSPPRDVEPKNVSTLKMDLDDVAFKALHRRFLLVEAMTPEKGLMGARRAFDSVSSINEKEALEAQKKALLDDIDRNGGMDAVLFGISDTWAAEASAHFEEILRKPEFTRGIGPGGQNYELDANDIAKMSSIAKTFFSTLQDKLRKEDLNALRAKLPTVTQKKVDSKELELPDRKLELPDLELTRRFADFLGRRAEHYLFDTVEGVDALKAEIEIPAKDDKPARKVSVELPRFRYPFAVRVAAANLVVTGRGQAPDWAFYERSRLKYRLIGIFQDKLAIPVADIDGVNMTQFPPEVVRWILDNQKVLAAFTE
jgi:hypothetical protein